MSCAGSTATFEFSVVVVSDGCATRLIGRPAQGPPPATRSWVAVAQRQPSNVAGLILGGKGSTGTGSGSVTHYHGNVAGWRLLLAVSSTSSQPLALQNP